MAEKIPDEKALVAAQEGFESAAGAVNVFNQNMLSMTQNLVTVNQNMLNAALFADEVKVTYNIAAQNIISGFQGVAAAAEETNKSAGDAVQKTEEKTKSLTQTVTDASNSFKKVTDSAAATGKSLQSAQDKLAALAGGVGGIEELKSALTDMKAAGEGVKTTITSVQELFKNMNSPVGLLAAGFTALYDNSESFKGGVDSLVKNLAGSLMPIVGSVKKLFDSFSEAGKGLAESVGAQLTPILDLLSGALTEVLENAAPIIETVLGMAGEILPELIAAIQPVIDTIGEMLKDVLPPLLETIMPIVSVVLELAKNILPVLMSAIKPIIEVFAALVEMIMPLVSSLFGQLGDKFKETAGFMKMLSPLLDMLAGLFSDNLAGGIKIFNDLLSTVVVPIINTVKDALNMIIKLVKGDFKGAFESMKSFFYNIASSVFNVFKLIIKSILIGVESFVNFFIEAINLVIKGLNLIPFVKIPLLAKVEFSSVTDSWQLPAMAAGGIVNAPTLALVGEGRYPEAVVPLGSSPQFDEMKSGIAAAVLEGLRGTGERQSAEVVLNVDSTKLARVIIPAIDRENRRRGFTSRIRSV